MCAATGGRLSCRPRPQLGSWRRPDACPLPGGAERRRSRWWIRADQVLIPGMLKRCRSGGFNLQRLSRCGDRRLRLDSSAVSPVISHGSPPRSVFLLLERLTSADLLSEISGDGEHLTRQTLPSDQSALFEPPLTFVFPARFSHLKVGPSRRV